MGKMDFDSLSMFKNGDYIGFLASEDAKIVERKDPVDGRKTRYIKRKKKGLLKGGKHLVGKVTSGNIIDTLLEKYGNIENINKAIEERKRQL